MNIIKYSHEQLQKTELGEKIYTELYDIIISDTNTDNKDIIENCLIKYVNKNLILYDMLLYYLLFITTNDNKPYLLKLHKIFNDFSENNKNIRNELTKHNECYKCYHKRNIPANHHIQCINPDENMKGDEHGIKQGWFYYPFCFDPIWKLEKCNNFIFMGKKYDKKL